MSFSSDTKNELSRIIPEKKCCQLAEIAGFLRVAGSLRLVGRGGFKIVISSDSPDKARLYKRLIQEYFQVETELEIGDGNALRKTNRSYHITIDPDMRSDSILRETGILLVRQGNNYISDGIYPDIIRTKCCRKSYLRGIFLGAGSVNDPNKSYHLEFTVGSSALASDLKKLINTFDDLSAKVVERKGKFVVYMKSAQYISDTLAIMGAHTQMLQFEDVRIKKELVNHTMRMTNCDTANTDRMLDASQRQVEAINKLIASEKYGKMPAKLKELAELRLNHPDMSLTQLGELLDPPLKKSGVNNRMKRIMDLAEVE